MEVILIRHTSVDVPPGTCYGQTDVALCPTFPEEAAQVARALQSEGVLEAVYTSPLNRCTRLATYCGYADAVCDDRLLEINFGDWEMQRYDEITDPRLHIWYKDYLHVAATGGESFMEQLHRVSLFMKDLCGWLKTLVIVTCLLMVTVTSGQLMVMERPPCVILKQR